MYVLWVLSYSLCKRLPFYTSDLGTGSSQGVERPKTKFTIEAFKSRK